MVTVKSTDSKQVVDTSHEREMLVGSTLTNLTVGAVGCSVHQRKNNKNKSKNLQLAATV